MAGRGDRVDGLGVEDDFGNLPILHRCAIVVPSCVTEGEAGLCPRGGGLVGHLAQTFGAIVRVRALGGGGVGGIVRSGCLPQDCCSQQGRPQPGVRYGPTFSVAQAV